MGEMDNLMELFRDKIMMKGLHVYNGKVVSIPTSGMLYYSGYGTMIEAGELFFDALLLQYYGNTQVMADTLKLYLSYQRSDGFLPRMVSIDPRFEQLNPKYRFEKNEHAQPFLLQTALLTARARGGATDWLEQEEYEALCRYLGHWIRHWVRDDSGLCVWNSAQHRMADENQDSAGTWRSLSCQGVDLACCLMNEYKAAAQVAKMLDKKEDVREFTAEAEKIQEKIQRYFWNEEDGFFYDRDVRTGTAIKKKHSHCLDVLAYGAASQEQAERIVKEHIQNPEEFWSEYSVWDYAKNEPGATDVMKPRNAYALVHGLQRYGYQELARELAEHYEKMILRQPLLCEGYHAETGEGYGKSPYYTGVHMLLAFLKSELEAGFNPYEIFAADVPTDCSEIGQRMNVKEILSNF